MSKYYFEFKNTHLAVECDVDKDGYIDGGLIVKVGENDISDLIEPYLELWSDLIERTYEAINEERGGR